MKPENTNGRYAKRDEVTALIKNKDFSGIRVIRLLVSFVFSYQCNSCSKDNK